jgi:hypothetical protein
VISEEEVVGFEIRRIANGEQAIDDLDVWNKICDGIKPYGILMQGHVNFSELKEDPLKVYSSNSPEEEIRVPIYLTLPKLGVQRKMRREMIGWVDELEGGVFAFRRQKCGEEANAMLRILTLQ